MVSSTFKNLPAEKQSRIRQALLTEFSQYPLAEAQVARIVKNANIARGAFYKYFEDLTDAYNYEFGIAMIDIHRTMPEQPTADNINAYVDSIRRFISETEERGYRQLVKLHYQYNEGFLGSRPTVIHEDGSGPIQWAMTVLYHQTVRDIVLDPTSMDPRIEQLRTILKKVN
ncbi:TetR/AcrR family transcriptional regulator [Lactobacillus sp. LC28-10]|uniref:TetR/AcrR family transcriptional regulator n=1 Tax=Secundilactobacillus angelensis TaxID=2722706 RepID=A0ABX1L1P0_9LACO|nr:TetR/AcrR family transcriptional regulator [Secundilactobacillus angelensis]MCH5462636.1 TetR/AcrR family transcriptional regulator [Secundilactobacillus angelensis]NLR19128.1 TetR/AcrR family transcriptional regulator [Secundilactobacillus angelensis]